ncbi:MAG: alpha/beta hydrolase, partial [Oscillospiraceae bacterium]|nr:alpha/beta hydrolase [Oscillospiraceae bacterium]
MKYIFVHGMGQTGEDWRETLSRMGAKIDSECPDLRKMTEEEICYENLRQSFFGYCNGFPEKINLCGLSLGGMLSLDYAVNFPERVYSLVLIGTQYKPPKNLLKFQNFLFKLMPGKAFEGSGFNKREFMALSESMAELDFTEKLPKISCKTLVIIGEKDSPNKKAAMVLAE